MIRKNGGIYLIAEIGGNHEGDFDKAVELLHQAADAGADAVKFQIYTGDSLVNKIEDPARVKHFDRFALSEEQYVKLALECKSRDVDFCASVWSERLIKKFSDYMPFIKIGSGDLTAFPILKKLAKLNKPIILSTGLATMDEVESSIEYLCNVNSCYKKPDMLAILQCTSMYPIPDCDAHLSVITSLKKKFPYRIGYSDHTKSTYAVELAIALGSSILEVHFTDNKESSTFRDHQVSFTSNDLLELRLKINTIHELLGDGIKRPMLSEIKSGHLDSFRRALYPKHTIEMGHVVEEDDLTALRPAHGLGAENIMSVVGKSTTRRLSELQMISMDDFS